MVQWFTKDNSSATVLCTAEYFAGITFSAKWERWGSLKRGSANARRDLEYINVIQIKYLNYSLS